MINPALHRDKHPRFKSESALNPGFQWLLKTSLTDRSSTTVTSGLEQNSGADQELHSLILEPDLSQQTQTLAAARETGRFDMTSLQMCLALAFGPSGENRTSESGGSMHYESCLLP
ncbi:hypothetical protein IRJ41_003699 [Triplophysa rosa]|uniref:Uncharacterized protein n=1 Tax=Triplophysa rosa TaxID=992332 RepID=A0A9W7WBE6_TRIRA|nr:hypothetical protein IRJ41_003699 [Triplophysa rosa]